MHEMALAEGIVQLVEDAVRTDGCRRVSTIWVEVGQLAAVEKEALQFCFEAVASDTAAQGATLKFIDAPGQGWCVKCAATVPIAALYEACPLCGNYQIQVTGGDTLRVKELEVE
ncbi:MAG: hydrogenase maturation nickel metallochaperone HypA [Gallionellaceae bacterium]|jgi:hydrogenase nickel incorporation protein HypA/HybF